MTTASEASGVRTDEGDDPRRAEAIDTARAPVARAPEWLEADGLGGYAMGTADGIRTRRYHGLLIAAARPPGGRMLLVGDLEVYAGEHALSSHRYAGDVVHPDGAARLVVFTAHPWPRWEHALPGGGRIAQEVVVVPGAARVVVRWTRLAGAPVVLRVRPLLAGRDHHALHHENGAFRFEPERAGDALVWRPYDGVPAIAATFPGAAWRQAPDWYRRFRYADEVARGLDAEEDLASPGEWTVTLGDAPVTLAFAAGAPVDDAAALLDAEAARRGGVGPWRAADAYLVARDGGRTVIAGYPWFTDWGRDTFISLRGLCLARRRYDEARAILLAWCGALSEGMLPNRFVEAGEAPEYNSVDASLWFVVAAGELLATPGACDAAARRALEDTIAAIVAGYAAGTRHGIRADADGLLACGEPGVQLTWMDAKVGDRVITPRTGKPVEVQALWVNALAIAGRRDAAARARAAFEARFWNPARGMLYDVVDCDHVAGAVDPSCRPNQLFAVGGGLPVALVEGARARAVVDACERLLWTPAGPRSLAPGEPGYQRWYGGGPAERDGAYHQGPVWTWLAGPFVEAWARVRGGTPDAWREARERFVMPLAARASDGLNHLAELAQPEPPHAPCGCPFQAWSLAEMLRVAFQVAP